METYYDCQTCGACCLGDPGAGPGYVELTADDQRRLKRLGLPLVHQAGDRVALGTVPYAGAGGNRVCVAFAGTVGDRCSCTIRAIQPQACQQFEVGSPLCRLARYHAGLGPSPQEWDAPTPAVAAI